MSHSNHHLLVTNDFPPKIGGIQSYLHELWRRLPPAQTTVLTTAHPGDAAFDAAQGFRIERHRGSFLVPTPALVRRIDALAAEVDAKIVLLDPAWPLGVVGPLLERPFGVVLHGAEVTIPARLPFVQLLLRRTLRQSRLVVAAGGYPSDEGSRAAGRRVPAVVVPPGVDGTRFRPLDDGERRAARARWDIADDALCVLCVSRLVPRKGIDVLIQAAARLAPDYPKLRVVVAGEGRDRLRLEQLSEALDSPVQFVGGIDDADLPALYGCSDVFAMLCRDRWVGLEQEGFGIVFLEAAAAGLPALAGLSGGSAEAVLDGRTGTVIAEPRDVEAVAEAIARMIDEPATRQRFGAAARERALRLFDYDTLAATLLAAIDAVPELPDEAPPGSVLTSPAAPGTDTDG